MSTKKNQNEKTKGSQTQEPDKDPYTSQDSNSKGGKDGNVKSRSINFKTYN
ncbi:hypothetical protein B9G69_012555 [Bdellovibrio sp. SKB1291214]|uniref:hypothetical protein n=1 Tax=Bdellovibrio sp. SKB1291214 TaxID=1732569 RepID=UPI001596370F|nr:hypothetical protein [Bdellovibrio sp. SKB1291214]UYL07877.1 hypothetical protein B9G69_012555 [Bdellovibrio sp. SKB1291214]